jgi:regulator of replication initiation timing
MVEKLHKMVNGEKVFLTKKEEAELRAEWAIEETEKQNNAWKEGRKKEYPSINDQLDTLYHEGYEGWKAKIKAIKDKYPKPTEI